MGHQSRGNASSKGVDPGQSGDKMKKEKGRTGRTGRTVRTNEKQKNGKDRIDEIFETDEKQIDIKNLVPWCLGGKKQGSAEAMKSGRGEKKEKGRTGRTGRTVRTGGKDCLMLEFFVLFDNGAKVSIFHAFPSTTYLTKCFSYFENVTLEVVYSIQYDWRIEADRYRGKYKGPYVKVIQ